jgi:serine/threonine protein kinase
MSTTVRSDRLPVHPATTQIGRSGAENVPAAAYPFLAPPEAPGEIGRLAGYRVFRLLGAGGMGKVFLAEDLSLRREVALKVMSLPPGEDVQNGAERFLREARALAAIKHPNLVTVYQAGEDRGTVYLAMELLEGETLSARIRREAPLAVPELVRIGEEIARGLAAVHARGLIHRDIKPGNVWLERVACSGAKTEPDAPAGCAHAPAEPDRVKILDFGLVREIDSDTHLTGAGVVVGTPAYMSPEQARGRALDHRTDLFSLGCVLYAMATGRTPFEASSPLALVAALASDEPTPARAQNANVPEPLSDLIAALLAKNPDDRPASAEKVIERLRGASGNGTRDRSRVRLVRWRYAVAIVALIWLVAGGLLAVALTRTPKSRTDTEPDPVVPAPGEPPVPVVDYLRDLPILDERPFPPPGAPRPPNVDGTVRYGGAAYPHGLFMHGAPPFGPPAYVRYALGKRYSRFTTEVAMNDTANKWSGLQFYVLCDGAERWHSRKISPGDPKELCDIDVRAVNVLTLEVHTIGPHQGAHGVWLDPRLTK